MLGFIGEEVPGDDFELSFSRPPLSERSGRPLLLAFGDPVAGPYMGMFYDAPSTPEELAGPPDLTPAHSHSCDNFRICMVGELWVGKERYHHGEFRIQESGRPYGSDGDAPHVDGNWRLIMFADRRGHRVRAVNPEIRAQMATTRQATLDYFTPHLPELLDDDDPGVIGMGTNLGARSKLGHIDGTFADTSEWDTIGHGARVAAALLGLPELGPLVMLVHTPAGEVAAPAATYDSDTFRCVTGGSAVIDGAERRMGDVLVKAAGISWPAVVAGPDGLDECFVVGDRRGAVPHTDDARWAGEIAALIAKLEADVRTPAVSNRR
jgi:hypothetical protein